MVNYFLSAFASFALLLASTEVALADVSGCAGCHASEVRQWSRSQHAVAMAPATPDTVAGNFSNGRYADSDVQASFRREDDGFVIRVNEGGNTREWQVRYTFGVYPLQQYLIAVGSGRLQAFNIAWDTRPESEGGRRWFRLDVPDQNHPGDALHWTGVYQNWNNQCADCHSTGLKRNYDAESDSYDTRWQQVSVGCAACHESAEEHVQAALEGESLAPGIELAAMGGWLVSQGKQPPRHQGRESSPNQVASCGRCHSLRTSLTDQGGGLVHDQFSLTRLDQPLYYSDGRVREEVFVLGSFEQSKMFRAGVVCSDCHNPHTGKLKAQGNAVCTQCHNAADFDTSEHHHHPESSDGAQCVNCHMPESTFMKIDARREHSFMVPRPDISNASGSPDVCLGCHTDKNRDWSIAEVDGWFPQLYERETWYKVQQRPPSGLMEYLRNPNAPALRRATLLEQQGQWLAQEQPSLVASLSASDEAVIRESAFRVLRYGSADYAGKLGETGLIDSSLAVRIAAFESLTWLGVELDSVQWEKVRGEYEHFLKMQSDLPSGLVLKARYLLARDFVYKAERELEKALNKDSGYAPATILLTDILRSGGRNLEAIDAINRTLEQTPDDASLIHLRGLINLKLKDYSKALEDLERATSLAPDQWLFGYRYAVALFQLQKRDEARKATRALLERFPENPQLKALMKHL
ncbi:putative CXXCH cytochrome family protein [Marinobacter pelagius]|uniref:Putative CXXCH cytochrome family protein n=1 Tax=Marinobacter pelagius TaxID=379482 RepID=A0A366GWE0_9GAMM|nr:tetratricopeptide repeat protein [Marinobacter pelagius]RBP32254.1 putative CXXCH cytochrome family protein [Marinobacter pelagius]